MSSTFANRMDYSFKGVNHYVNMKQKKDGKKVKVTKQILNDINGTVKAGEMCAIMGPSGAGKTTLLDILAHRLRINGSGKLMLNGVETSFNVFRKLSGYVTQSDTLAPAMTVRETLQFYAQLKIPKNVSYEDKMKKVEDVIAEIGLKRCADTLVGNEKIRGISGGERRRVTIAIELLTGPSVLFLDEPTSGLDASTSYSVIKAVKKLANSGRTVICTIHQPRSNIYEMFDKLLLLADGSTIYYGEADRAVNYFSSLGYECNANINPADFFNDDDDEDEVDVSKRRIKKLTPEEITRLKKLYTESDSNVALKASLDHLDGQKGEITFTKNPMSARIQIMTSIFQGLLCGLVYYQLGVGQTSIQSRTGVLAFLIMGLGFPSVMATIQVFPDVITIFLKDRASGVYKTLPFFFAKSTIDVVIGAFTPIIMGTIVYWMSNQRIEPFYAAAPFFKFLLALVMVSQVALSFGVMISCAVPSVAVGTAVGPPFVILFFLFSGFFINLNDVPKGWIWAPYISFFKYAIEASVVNAFKGIKFSCKQSEMIAGQCPTQTGEQVIERMDYDMGSFWRNVLILLLYVAVFRVLAFAILSFKSRDKLGAKKVEKSA
eukprot:gene16722-19876_t